ncbi:hypothetical protein JFX23_05675 [Schaalia cardiffensis]|uniref:hypothetical protein n=1 Tax=Schaalia cardiffensis TaxID=181487 RepID=UPI0018E7326A|nr:hypothetical protein [Schaalia cardiffensis]MBJ2329257.1 hypothetical protein [Schaalia cardiffensis]
MLPKLAASALVISVAALGLSACSNSSNGDAMKDPASTNQQMKDSGSGDAMKDGDKMKDGDAMKDGDKMKDGDGMKDGDKMKDGGSMSEDSKDSMKK